MARVHQEGDPRHCGLCAQRGGHDYPHLPENPPKECDVLRAQYERFRQAPAVAAGLKKAVEGPQHGSAR